MIVECDTHFKNLTNKYYSKKHNNSSVMMEGTCDELEENTQNL